MTHLSLLLHLTMMTMMMTMTTAVMTMLCRVT
jgi:hypothetical protein